MKIERIELRHIRLELAHPFETSFGRFTDRHLVLLHVEADCGACWAEAPSLVGPYYSAETTQTTLHVLREFLGPAVLGEEIESPAELHRRMAFVRGNNIAKSGLDTAVHHLLAADAGQSLATYLGGERETIEAGISVGIERSLDDLVDYVGKALDGGFGRVKLKIKPGWDVEPVRAIRAAFGDVRLQVDANSAYTLDDAEHLAQLDEFDLLMIEQPLACDDIYEHSLLQRKIATPVCLDESIESVADARCAVQVGACRVVNIKLSRVGGLLPAVQIHDLCAAHGVPVWCGGMVESAIGQADCIALASLPNFVYPADIGPSERYFQRDVIVPFIRLESGTIRVPTEPGLGYVVDEEFIEVCTLEAFVV